MRVGIVGTGFVGAAAAYAMTLRGSAAELVLTDVNADKARAEARDIQDATPFSHPLRVSAGDYASLDGCRVVVLTAGVNQKPGETRLQLLERNARIFEEVVPQVVQAAPEAVLLVATNPVDVLTTLVERIARLPEGRVIGSGTALDTARMRALIAEKVGVDPGHVHGYVLGEHGDSEVLAWRSVDIAGLEVARFCEMRGLSWGEVERAEIDTRVRRAAYEIIAGKGATYYGIGTALARITESIVRDQRAVLTVSSSLRPGGTRGEVAYSLPRLVGGAGILATLETPLDPREQQALAASEAVIAEAAAGLK
ncbi:L-lactate dehydrogenase [Deinobacterium chartae]|uniref:L-lactate dehydrogenase n=1 Tax=Deinobacterium chartae TaxID=521158 RepID=A0A841I4J0_9DEIO|nr:L-lactate dehydrogenase [Deinobacterium chartae]MBB6099330.1 L-lactate dehydrogenase [Deinobacterium chartae]